MTPTLSQVAESLDLAWSAGDPVVLTVTIAGGADWAADTYDVESSNATIALMTAVAVISNTVDAVLTLTLPTVSSALLPAGVYDWRLQTVGGPTKLAGRVHVS